MEGGIFFNKMPRILNNPFGSVQLNKKFVSTLRLDGIDRSPSASLPAQGFSAVFGPHTFAKTALAVPFNLAPSMIFHRISPSKLPPDSSYTPRQR